MSGFRNYLTTKLGKLTVPQIQSPNFLAGISGWIIRKNGSAEFNNVVIRGGQIESGTALYYSGAPAAGNLVASIAAAAGTDSKGNAYLAGEAVYGLHLGTWHAISLSGGLMTFWSAASEAGPWTSQGTIAVQTGGMVLTGLLTAQSTLIEDANAAGNVLQVINDVAAPSASAVRLIAAAAADKLLGIKVTGDTVDRLVIDSGGQLAWGPGGAGARDTVLYRAGATQLAASLLVADISGMPETWHDTAALANGWSKTGYFKYRLNALGNVEVAANLIVGTTTDFTVILSTALPAAYRPVTDQYVPVNTDQARTDTNTRPAALLFKADGTVQCFGIGGTAAHARLGVGTYPLGI